MLDLNFNTLSTSFLVAKTHILGGQSIVFDRKLRQNTRLKTTISSHHSHHLPALKKPIIAHGEYI
jgi:hypothetical protein